MINLLIMCVLKTFQKIVSCAQIVLMQVLKAVYAGKTKTKLCHFQAELMVRLKILGVENEKEDDCLLVTLF